MLTRRGFLLVGAGVGTAVVVPRALASGATATTAAAAAVADPFTRAMPVPPTLRPIASIAGTDIYRLALQPSTVEVVPGLQTEVLSYAPGFFGGPVIRARRDRPVALIMRNQLDEETNVHLHGGHVPAGSDGHPLDVIEPGAARLYRYPNRQAGATLWYHDHTHHLEADHVYRGAHGLYLVEDDDERRLRLPSGDYDVPIMLRDVKLDAAGALVSGPPADRPTILANGVAQPYFQVAARKYRFRLLNCSTTRLFQLSLDQGAMTQIGTDGGLLPAPVERAQLAMAAGERVEIVVDFSAFPVGTQLVLTDPLAGPVLRFDVTRTAADRSQVPAALRPLPALATPTVQRDVVFSMDTTQRPPVGLVNGKPYDPERADFEITRGSTETWRVSNGDATNYQHSFHLHLVQFRVLERNGGAPTADDAGLKDTIQLPTGSTVTVQATFSDYLGRYAFHCHMLDHSRVGMMAQMEIVP